MTEPDGATRGNDGLPSASLRAGPPPPSGEGEGGGAKASGSSVTGAIPLTSSRREGEQAAIHKLLFVAGELHDDSLGHGILCLARELRRRGRDIGLLCGGGDLVGEFGRIGIEPILAERLRAPCRWRGLPRRVLGPARAVGPQLIHLFGRSLAAWGPKLSVALGCPYVLTLLSLPPGHSYRLRGDWRRGSVAVVSEELRAQLVNLGRVPKAVLGVVPFGLHLDDYPPYRDTDGQDRVPVVGMVGPLTREGGGDIFLHAAKAILDAGHPAEFLVAGDGPDRSRLRRLAQRLGIHQAVTVVHGFPDYRQMIAVLDIAVFPGFQEGLSLSVLEAMACGKPVVAAAIGALYSVIADGLTGLLVPRGEAPALADGILRLLQDRALADRLAEAACEQIRDRYSVRASVERLIEFYSDCLRRVETA